MVSSKAKREKVCQKLASDHGFYLASHYTTDFHRRSEIVFSTVKKKHQPEERKKENLFAHL